LEEYEPELIIDELRVLPDPFDTNVAALKVWTDTNDPTDGYDVLLSSSVGTDIIEISVDETPLEVQIKIFQAEISLKFENCSPSYGEDYKTLFGQSGRVVEEQTRSSRRNTSSGNAGFSTQPEVGYSRQSESATETQRNTRKPDIEFEHHAPNAVRFGNWQSGNALSGQFVPQYRGWTVVRNDVNNVSGVVAALRVKKIGLVSTASDLTLKVA
jgi:hypothetical protein